MAKITGIELCKFYRREYGCNFISAMPTNLYGINDNFDLNTSHVLPALLRKFHEAKQQKAANVVLWGTGKPRREFLHVDDLADACLFLMQHYNEELHLNIGTGEDLEIGELATLVKNITGYGGAIEYDASKPDGTPRKLLDVSRLHHLGWTHRTPLEQGIKSVYEWYRTTVNGQRSTERQAR
jgi:GDP-L-fucose synthase